MRSEEYLLRAFWSARAEPVDECAKRAADMFSLLAAVDPCLGCWMSPTGRGRGLHRPVRPDEQLMRDEFAHGRSRRDSDGTAIEELGFRTHLSNGAVSESEGALLDIHCGAYTTALPAPNSVEIRLPREGGAADRLLCFEGLTSVVRAVVLSWDPNWCRVSTRRALDILLEDEERNSHLVGWMTYLSSRYGRLPPVPDEYRVVQLEGYGSLIVIEGCKRFTGSEPAHIDAARRLAGILEDAHMLGGAPQSVREGANESRR